MIDKALSIRDQIFQSQKLENTTKFLATKAAILHLVVY
jgi:hypothetical protein